MHLCAVHQEADGGGWSGANLEEDLGIVLRLYGSWNWDEAWRYEIRAGLDWTGMTVYV